MRITQVERRRRRLYQLWLDGTEGPTVDVTTFDESPYKMGSELTQDTLEALLNKSQYNRARERALYLLGLRDYACRELEKKLIGEATPEIAVAVVERLREVGLLDDERYAVRAAASMSQYKQYPRRRVEQELRRRGIDPALAQAAAEELDQEDFQQALALIEKRYYNKMNDSVSRQRVMAALGRRGFSYSAIRRAMEIFGSETHTDSEENEDIWQ